MHFRSNYKGETLYPPIDGYMTITIHLFTIKNYPYLALPTQNYNNNVVICFVISYYMAIITINANKGIYELIC